ncbi:MAG: hypothetical protein MPJ24_10875 [Pirellulaceae bacterium]|nr:hypothetical protein [Pirellulaceae bacterium]
MKPETPQKLLTLQAAEQKDQKGASLAEPDDSPIDVLADWIEERLEKVCQEYQNFRTPKSFKKEVGRS